MVKLRDLAYAVAVDEQRHFGRAASALGVSQPTLSGQLKGLEEQLGIVLFERAGRTVRPTDAATPILSRARTMLRLADEIRTLAQAARDPMQGGLRLGLIPTIGPYLLPFVISEFAHRLPKLTVELIEAETAVLEAKLHSGELDAAILATDPPDGMVGIDLYREPFWLATPEGHPLHRAERVQLDDIDPGSMLVLADGHCLSGQIQSLCRVSGGDGRLGLQQTSLETLLALVAGGKGITMVPATAVSGTRLLGGGLAVREIESDEAARDVRLVHRASGTRSVVLNRIADIIAAMVPMTVMPVRR